MELRSVGQSVKNLESNETSLSSLAQKHREIWDFKNEIWKRATLRKWLLKISVSFFLQYEIVYFSKFLSLNSALLRKNKICYRYGIECRIKFKLFSTRISGNLKFWPYLQKVATFISLSRIGNLVPFLRPAIHLSQNTRKHSQNARNEKCIAGYLAPIFSHSSQGWHSREKSNDFAIHFFAALKHKIHVKYEKYIVSVSYFAVCFAKTLAKYLWNVKYE